MSDNLPVTRSVVNCVKPDNPEMSVMLPDPSFRLSVVNCVKPANSVMSGRLLPHRFSPVNFVTPDNREMSVKLPLRFSVVNCVKPTNGVMLGRLLPLRFSVVNCVKPANGVMSRRLLTLRFSVVNCVNPRNAEMSVMLPYSVSVVNFVKPDNALMSEKPPDSFRSVRFVAFSNPVKSLIGLRPESEVNVFISASVTAAVAARFAPSALLITQRRLASGMFTFAAETGGAPASSTTPHIRTNTTIFVIKLLQIFIISPLNFSPREMSRRGISLGSAGLLWTRFGLRRARTTIIFGLRRA